MLDVDLTAQIDETDPEALWEPSLVIDDPSQCAPILQTAVRFAALDEQIKALEEEVRGLKKQRAALQDHTLNVFIAAGEVKSIKTATRAIYTRRQIFAAYNNGANNAMVCEELRRSGLSQFVTSRYDAEGVAALMAECEEHGETFEEAYPALARVVKPAVQITVQTRARVKGGAAG